MFPSRIPLALSDVNVRMLMTAVFPSAANQVFPGPSGPDGHSAFCISVNPVSVLDGDASTCAPDNGTGTSEDENGVAPLEKGTLGLLVLFSGAPVPWNDAINEPAKNRVDADELDVMERTSAAAPERPPNGGRDHELEFMSHTATDEPGDVNLPPTHTLLFCPSQYTALISPLGPLEPRAAKAPDDCVYDAILFAEVPLMDENDPAK